MLILRDFHEIICPYPSGLLHWHWGKDCPSAREATLKDMAKMTINKQQQNIAKHIFLVIYCTICEWMFLNLYLKWDRYTSSVCCMCDNAPLAFVQCSISLPTCMKKFTHAATGGNNDIANISKSQIQLSMSLIYFQKPQNMFAFL